MIDPQILKNDLHQVSVFLSKKGFTLDEEYYTNLEVKRKLLQSETENLQKQRNEYSKQVGILKSQGKDTCELLVTLNEISNSLKEKELDLNGLLLELKQFLYTIPNIPEDNVPEGKTEHDNEEVAVYGTKPTFDFPVNDHTDIGEKLGLLDFQRAAKLSGSRFVILKSELAKLQRALIQFMLDVHTSEHGYNELYVPYLVNEDCLYGTGALPKMAEDLYKISGDHDLYLIPTAEVPVTNVHQGEILNIADLPLKYVSHTPCFRSEAGSYGKDTKGMIRQHQFEKVELFQIVEPKNSNAALENLCDDAQAILKKLDLPYRVVNLCGGDLSFSSAKTYDLEVWLPSQGCYREISSCSNFHDFQARRAKIRIKNSTKEKPVLAHTLNGSGLAIGRTLVAIMENYQNSDGSVTIPEVLRPYYGADKITKK